VISNSIHAEKNQDIEVEKDETHVVGGGVPRSALLLGPGRSVQACGAAREARSGATAALAGGGVSVLAARAGRELRATIACDRAATCRLMEEEGIIWFFRQGCGKDASPGHHAVEVGSGRLRHRGGDIAGFWILDPITLKAHSLRLSVGGDDIACGRFR
jgi:hypothetical protein